MTLYRTGNPSSGVNFWTPDEKYARQVHEGALHKAELLPGARIKRLSTQIKKQVIRRERRLDECDIIVFIAENRSSEEYVVLNPRVIKVLL